MKYIILFGVLSTAIAQNYDWDEKKDKRGRNPEKMEQMIIWRLTDDLDLSTDQAEKFFPRFRDHRKNLEEIGIQERKIIENINREKLSKSDVKNTVEKISSLRQKRVKLESDFVLSLDDILDPDQMIRLGVFKQRMMMEMRDDFREGKSAKKRYKKKRKWNRRENRRF